MGQRSVEAEENIWPVFVDLLSTIVMVVTFLLIVMSIAISVISQNVAKSFIESMSEKTQQGGGDVNAVTQFTASGEFAAETQATKPDPQAKPETKPETKAAAAETKAAEAAQASGSSSASSSSASSSSSSQAETKAASAQSSSSASSGTETTPTDASAASASASDATETSTETAKAAQDNARFAPKLAEELKSSAPAEEGKELSVLSRQAVEGEKRIVVAGMDRSTEEPAANTVAKASALLTLQFDPVGTRIDDTTSTAVAAFFTENAAAVKDRPLVIWAFASATTVSVSEARRVAYYRALATRNELIKNGVTPENINVEIRFGETDDTLNTVQIMATK